MTTGPHDHPSTIGALPLTVDEERVVDAIARGATVEAVADILQVTTTAVVSLMAAALAKLAPAPDGSGPDRGAPNGEPPAIAVSLIGRFRVVSGGRDVTPTPGQPASVLQLLALHGRRLHVEEVIEHLWPEVDPSVGRTRLRNVLVRLRRTTGGVVHREDDHLVLDPRITTDLERFEHRCAEALALEQVRPDASVALATMVVDSLTGTLLPGARYEPWAQEACDAIRRRRLALFDLLARGWAGRGALDRALAYLDQAMAVEPYDECRYRMAADWLGLAGRHGAARAYLDRLDALTGHLVDSSEPFSVQVA